MVGGKTGNRYYCAEVKDVNQNSDTFLVEFEDKKTQWVAANRVRQRATAAPPAWRPAANEKVEVKCFSEGPNDPMFWAEAEVLVDRGEDYYSLKQIGSKQVELVDIHRLRPAFSHLKTDAVALQFHRYVIRLPQALQLELDLDMVRKRSGAGSLYYNESDHSVVVLGGEQSITAASMLLDVAVRNLLDIQRLEEVKEQAQAVSGAESLEFRVDRDMVRYIIGRGGENIKAAEAIDGIYNIDLRSEQGICIIKGNSKQALEQARERLDVVKKSVQVKQELVGGVIGKGGAEIKKIEEKTGVISATIDQRGGNC